MNRASRLEAFFQTFRDVAESPNAARLAAFVHDWRTIAGSAARPGVRLLNLDRLTAAFANLAEPLEDSRQDGRFLNPWAAAGLRRSEVRNASVLAHLWRREKAGQAGTLFLNSFLRIIENRSGIGLPTKASLDAGYQLRTEHCLAGERSERVDLTIEGRDFLIGVEVKIDAGEGDAQLDRYARALADRARLRRSAAVLIFLAPYAHRGAIDKRHGVPVVDATWQDLRRAADLMPNMGGDAFVRDLIDRFASHIAPF